MNQTNWYATFGAGTLLADLTDRLFANGQRAIAHGTCPQVGTGGHLTIGGLGPLSRQYGAALDHVEEVEVVLANGTIARANNDMNQDIFFAIKGAAASFGIITEFVVHTEPAPGQLIQYSYQIEWARLSDRLTTTLTTLRLGNTSSFADTFAAWQDIIKDPSLDRKLSTEVVVTEVGMIISGTYFGTQAEYDALNFESRLAQNATVSVTTIDNWLGAVTNWAETEALQLIGGVVSCSFIVMLKKHPYLPGNPHLSVWTLLLEESGIYPWYIDSLYRYPEFVQLSGDGYEGYVGVVCHFRFGGRQG
jgi:hypothetical protein